MRVKLAGEIMVPLDRFPYIPHWFSLQQAMAELSRSVADSKRIKHLPWMILVFSAQNQLLGIVRHEEIMRGLMPDVLRSKPQQYREKLFDVEADPHLYQMYLQNEDLADRLKRRAERPVSEVMMPIDLTVGHEDSVLLAICLMQSMGLSFIPVVNEGGVAGILDSVDAVAEVASLLV